MSGRYGDEVILCVANLSRSAQATELDLSPWKERIPLEMLGRTRFPAIGELPYMITLAPYGFYWFQLTERDQSERVAPSIVPEFETLVVPVGATWVSLARTRSVFECDVLPGLPGANPLVSGSLAGGYSPHPHLGDPVLRHRRQPPLSYLPRSDAARRDRALRAADADRVGTLRSRALQSARLRGRASGRAGRNLAGRRVRPDLHRASVAQSCARA